jgi:lipid-A-disaccharide synthase-like uncharacterized protein
LSPQYLIWVLPLVAYVGTTRRSWLLVWAVIGALTLVLFPIIFFTVTKNAMAPLLPVYQPVLFARNALLVGLVLLFFYQALRDRFVVTKPVDAAL